MGSSGNALFHIASSVQFVSGLEALKGMLQCRARKSSKADFSSAEILYRRDKQHRAQSRHTQSDSVSSKCRFLGFGGAGNSDWSNGMMARLAAAANGAGASHTTTARESQPAGWGRKGHR
mmetsp:Transcript_15514/g.44149  ORF Transcript_15514/g.44149 Transcript_15514/m.44149 type:complete len:120 (+) Transcript_15514:578-937(+)